MEGAADGPSAAPLIVRARGGATRPVIGRVLGRFRLIEQLAAGVLRRGRVHGKEIVALALSPDGSPLAAASFDRVLSISRLPYRIGGGSRLERIAPPEDCR